MSEIKSKLETILKRHSTNCISGNIGSQIITLSGLTFDCSGDVYIQNNSNNNITADQLECLSTNVSSDIILEELSKEFNITVSQLPKFLSDNGIVKNDGTSITLEEIKGSIDNTMQCLFNTVNEQSIDFSNITFKCITTNISDIKNYINQNIKKSCIQENFNILNGEVEASGSTSVSDPNEEIIRIFGSMAAFIIVIVIIGMVVIAAIVSIVIVVRKRKNRNRAVIAPSR